MLKLKLIFIFYKKYIEKEFKFEEIHGGLIFISFIMLKSRFQETYNGYKLSY